jgi:hypothetical protein
MTPGEVLDQLVELPPVSLLLGDGSWQLAERQENRLRAAGTYTFSLHKLDADAARWLRDQSQILPARGPYRVFLACLDGAGSQAQNILLKTLEEPPPSARFILAAKRLPLVTVVSRCRVFPLGSQPAPADDAEARRLRSGVGSAIKAARSGNDALLSQVVRGWEPGHARQLSLWAAEAASGRWRQFTPDFAAGVTAAQALRVLTALSEYAGARGAPRVALDRAFLRR